MRWTFLATATVVYLAIIVVVPLVWDRRQRALFVAGLSPAEFDWLRAFETFKGQWRDFRDLRQRDTSPAEKFLERL
jgi:hypothetical protein